MRVSIVAAYHNRKDLIYKSLKSISLSKYINDTEIIIVDDCSDAEHNLDNIGQDFPNLNIKVIKLLKENKWYTNPCIPYNIGFKEATGDIIIIQNPESFHCGDVISHVVKTINTKNYLTYACYSLDEEWSDKLNLENYNTINLENRIIKVDGDLGWYNHSIFRPAAYHFLSAITNENLKDLGGFDERYAEGRSYDDNEILARIRRKGLDIKIIDDPYCFHQWHYSNPIVPNGAALNERNRNLFHNVTLRETTYKANQK